MDGKTIVDTMKHELGWGYCLEDVIPYIDAALAAEREKYHALEMKYRERLWLGHGHHGQYGDDGEMQCSECLPFGVVDYKRESLLKLERAVGLVAIRARTP